MTLIGGQLLAIYLVFVAIVCWWTVTKTLGWALWWEHTLTMSQKHHDLYGSREEWLREWREFTKW